MGVEVFNLSRNTDERRAKAVAHFNEYESVSRTAKKFGVSEQTIYNWARKVNETKPAQRSAPSSQDAMKDAAESVLSRENQRLHAENMILGERLDLTTRLLGTYLSN